MWKDPDNAKFCLEGILCDIEYDGKEEDFSHPLANLFGSLSLEHIRIGLRTTLDVFRLSEKHLGRC